MIGKDEIDAAAAILNPQTAAVNTVLGSFGAQETVPYLVDVFAQCGVDPDAARGLGLETLQQMAGEPEGYEPRSFVEGLIHGFLLGVLAARQEDSDG